MRECGAVRPPSLQRRRKRPRWLASERRATPSPAYDSGYAADGTTSAAPPVSNYQTLYPPATDAPAHLTVKVPADARLWFEDTPTTSTGPVRAFHSPPLLPGGRYTYNVRATWNENGHEATQTQHVGVAAGARVEVDFPVKPETTAQPAVTPTR